METEYEICVLCRKETNIPVHMHIDCRVGYVEGVGQLCYDCMKKDVALNYQDE